MARILDRKQLVYEIKELFFDAKEYVYLISPYIDLKENPYFIRGFEYANSKGVEINVVYSKGFRKRTGQEVLKRFENLQLSYIADLHMKVFFNDYRAIISSLNLYDYSIKNNLECGMILYPYHNYEDKRLYKELMEMLERDVYMNQLIEKKRELS